jgi:mono/diheme cytochrome c family protein
LGGGPLSLDIVEIGNSVMVDEDFENGEVSLGFALAPGSWLLRQTRTKVAGVELPFQPEDEGSRDFHAGPKIACASCHPEGRDDGVVWRFGKVPRRTQSLSGDVTGTAPFHWKGDLPDVETFMDEVMVKRMGRPKPSARQVASMRAFLARIPKLPAPSDLDDRLVGLGRRLFESEEVGCAGCHWGPQFADGSNAAVGTGASFQVPRLVDVSARPPFLHDGCAPTLVERFTEPRCGGGDQHGTTSQLSEDEIAALVEYLRSL